MNEVQGQQQLSYKDWLAKYYPTPARDFHIAENDPISQLAAARHSLIKWSGLSKATLSKHGLLKEDTWIMTKQGDYDVLGVDSDSCALCVLVDSRCSECPGTIANNGKGCDGGGEGAYQSFIFGNRVGPMQKWLRKTVKYLESKQSKET
jgi:hypothetical protein